MLSPFVQQQAVRVANDAANGLTTAPEELGLLWYLNNVYFGTLPASFGGTSVTGFQPTVNGTVACSSCHDPAWGFTDRLQVAVGVKGRVGQRNSPTVARSSLSSTVCERSSGV